MDIVALLPYKGVSNSKTRLSGILTPSERKKLSLEMLKRVMKALTETDVIRDRILLGGDQHSYKFAVDYNFSIMPCNEYGLNQSLKYALNELEKRGTNKVLILSGDIPLITSFVINTIICISESVDVVIAPSWNLDGTNVLVIPTKYAGHLSYGKGSFLRHLKNFNSLSTHVAIVYCLSTALDIDTPREYVYWTKMCTDRP